MKDPVCGMKVSVRSAAASLDHQGKSYFFCSLHCLEAFRKNPDGFGDRQTVGGTSFWEGLRKLFSKCGG